MRVWILALAALPLGACATITRGTDEQVQFMSEPSGAEVTTTLGSGCPATPCTLMIPRKDQFVATFKMPGYRSENVMVGTRMSGGGTAGMVGNALVGGIIGVAVDASSGASMDHFPNPVVVSLVPSALPSGQRRRAPRGTPVSELPAKQPHS
jgi:hypothetical protein